MPGRGHRRRRGRGRRRIGLLQPALLLLLHHGPAHGYTLLDQLGAFGMANLSPSVVYRTLRNMEDEGWVTSSWDREETQGPPRRVYQLTVVGDQVLASWIQEIEEAQDQINYLLRSYYRHIQEGQGAYHEDS